MPLVLTDIQDRVMTIRLNRADKKNALTQAMYRELETAVTDAAGNPEVRVVLLVGSGGAFCAGNDLQDFLKLDHSVPKADNPVLRFMHAQPTSNGCSVVTSSRRTYTKPVPHGPSCHFCAPLAKMSTGSACRSMGRTPHP